MNGPDVHVAAGLPKRVRIWEVGPRDGLQNESVSLPTALKVELVGRLVRAGLRTVEVTGFVSPRWVPQLADTDEVLGALTFCDGIHYPVLVPNEVGLQRAMQAGVRDIAVFASATESFSKRNLNRSVSESLAMFTPVITEAIAHDIAVRAYVSMCFGDPWEGRVPIGQVVDVALRLRELGCWQLSIGDTIGVATPGHVEELISAFLSAGIGPGEIAVHFHDTYGQALANTLAALRCGVETVDSSAGGLGGCPYAEGAAGNLATEDLVWMLDGLGIESGVDLSDLVATSRWVAGHLGRPSPSSVVRAWRQDGGGMNVWTSKNPTM